VLDPTHFWSSVDIGDPDECWPWRGERAGKPGYEYGRVRIGPGRASTGAHRIAYQLHTGRSAGDLKVLHSCDNPPCCNPLHLRAGTQGDNMRDASDRGRATSRRKVNPEQVGEIRKLYADGVPSSAIGRRFGISQQQAHRLATGTSQRRNPVSVNDPDWKRAGHRNARTKISDAQVDRIRRLYAAGSLSQREIGEMFGVSQSHVCKVVNFQDRSK
jgi:hypothetical protein